MYTLLFDKKFKADLKKLDKSVRDRILRKVFQLEKYPELGKHRVLYTIKKNELQVLVLTVDHRRKAYENI